MYYPCNENKGADQLRGYREADLRLCFRICKKPDRFSHDEAQLSFKYFSYILTQDDLKVGPVYIVAREKFNHMATAITTIIFTTRAFEVQFLTDMVLAVFHPDSQFTCYTKNLSSLSV